MRKYKVCNKWTIEIPDNLQPTSDNIGSIARPYTYYIDHKLPDMGYQAWCREYLLNRLDGVSSVVEYFGGIGMDAAIVEGVFDLERHTLIDLDAGCVDILAANYPEAEVIQGDFIECAGVEADLALCDFERFTILHMTRNRDGVRDALGDVLSACGCCIVTDSAISHLHLNLDIYSDASGILVKDIHTYAQALSDCFYYLGFHVEMVAYNPHASYVTLLPGYTSRRVKCVKAPSSARDCFRGVR